MTEEKEHEADLQLKIKIKLHEEKLLPQRLLVFLMTSSILFLAFAQLSQVPENNVAKALSIVGLITCFIALVHGRRVKDQMDKMDDELQNKVNSQLKKILGIEETPRDWKSKLWSWFKKWFKGRTIFLWLGVVFGGLWGLAIWHAFFSVGEWRFWTFWPPVGFLIIWIIWGTLEKLIKEKQEVDSLKNIENNT